VPLSHKFAKQSRVKICCNERTQSTPFDPKLMFWDVSDFFRYCTKVDEKLVELVPLSHKFAKQNRVIIFHNERTRSIPLDPKLMFWGVSDRFVTARKSMQNRPNWCHYRTSSLNKVAWEFFETNAPNPLHWTLNSSFCAIRTVSLVHESQCKTGRTGAIIAQVR
jgi:hypothetical protein